VAVVVEALELELGRMKVEEGYSGAEGAVPACVVVRVSWRWPITHGRLCSVAAIVECRRAKGILYCHQYLGLASSPLI